MNYESIKHNYEAGLWSAALVSLAVRKGIITQAQADDILRVNQAQAE